MKKQIIKQDVFNEGHYYIDSRVHTMIKLAIKNYADGLKLKYKHLKADRYKKDYELMKKLIKLLEKKRCYFKIRKSVWL